MVILDVTIVNVALPSIRTALDFSEHSLPWVMSAYTVTFAGFLMLGGRAGDLLGRKRMFLIGVGVFTFASLVGALATSATTLVVARGLQGLGSAILAPATLAIIATTFIEGPERNRALGIWGAIGAVAGSIGALLGGFLTTWLGWRWILLVNIPIGGVLLPMAWRHFSESRGSLDHRHFDLAGAVTLTAGQVALVLGIISIETSGFVSVRVLGSIGAGIVLLLLFLMIEHRWAKAPLVPLSVFRSRTLTGANLVMILMYLSMLSMWYLLSLQMQEVLGMSPLLAGIAFVPMAGTLAVTSTLAPRLVARLGVRTMLTIGLLLIAVGMFWLSGVSATGNWVWEILPPSMVASLGMGLALVPLTIAAVSGVPSNQAGLASGLVNTSRQIGGALGVAALSTLAAALTANRTGAEGLTTPDAAALAHGYSGAFMLSAAFALAGALVALLMIPRSPSVRPGRVAEPDASAG